jgi:hypothetical protein
MERVALTHEQIHRVVGKLLPAKHANPPGEKEQVELNILLAANVVLSVYHNLSASAHA